MQVHTQPQSPVPPVPVAEEHKTCKALLKEVLDKPRAAQRKLPGWDDALLKMDCDFEKTGQDHCATYTAEVGRDVCVCVRVCV